MTDQQPEGPDLEDLEEIPGDPGPVPEDGGPETFADLWASLGPGRVARGVYSIYKTDAGGLHIAYRADGATEDAHLEIPAVMVSMMAAATEGKGPLGRIRALAAGRLGLG